MPARSFSVSPCTLFHELLETTTPKSLFFMCRDPDVSCVCLKSIHSIQDLRVPVLTRLYVCLHTRVQGQSLKQAKLCVSVYWPLCTCTCPSCTTVCVPAFMRAGAKPQGDQAAATAAALRAKREEAELQNQVQ